MDAAEYKHVVLGLIFLKYISDAFDEHYEHLKSIEDETGADPEDKDEYTYTTKIVTSNTSFNYPTHEKKVKSVYIKLYTNEISLLSISVILDGRIVIDPKTYTVRVNDEGELEYVLSVNPETLGTFEIGEDKLGGSTQQTHKVVVGGKGKNITLSIEQNARNMFGIVSIGYLYKLGKVREG